MERLDKRFRRREETYQMEFIGYMLEFQDFNNNIIFQLLLGKVHKSALGFLGIALIHKRKISQIDTPSPQVSPITRSAWATVS